jgi:hypothetical protein
MNVEAASARTPEQAHLRSRRFCLWGLLLALPLALWVSIGDNWTEYLKKNHEEILDAPAGAAFAFEGGRWRLESAEILPTDPADVPLPPNTVRVRMVISVTPQDAAAVERLSRCEVALSSPDGRRWTPGLSALAFRRALPYSCHGDYRVHPQPGELFRFQQTFTVPASVAEEVEPLIILPKKSPDAPQPRLRLRRR